MIRRLLIVPLVLFAGLAWAGDPRTAAPDLGVSAGAGSLLEFQRDTSNFGLSHVHDGTDGSSQPKDWIPDEHNSRTIGSSTTYWLSAWITSGTFRTIDSSTVTTTNLTVSNNFTPPNSLGFRNKIGNSMLRIWQRYTSAAAIASGGFISDMFLYSKSGAMVHTASRNTSVPTVADAGVLAQYSMLLDVTTADTSIAAGEFSTIQTVVEGHDWTELAQRNCTLSFWVKTTSTGTFCVSLRNSGTDRSYVAEYTVSAASTWEKKTVTVSSSPSAGTWDYTSGVGIYLDWILACGSNFLTTAGAWQTGNFQCTSSQVNFTSSTANDFYLALIQLEPGSVATPFENVAFADDIERVQRYYQKSYNLTTDVGQNVAVGAAFKVRSGGNSVASVQLRTRMRTTPTITTYSPVTGSSGQIRDYGSGVDRASSVTNVGETAFEEIAGLGGDGDIAGFQWAANAWY